MKNDPSTHHSSGSRDLHPGEQPPMTPDTAQPADERAWDVFLPEDDLEPLPEEFADPWWERDEEPLE